LDALTFCQHLRQVRAGVQGGGQQQEGDGLDRMGPVAVPANDGAELKFTLM
jgi:hypothetical protein